MVILKARSNTSQNLLIRAAAYDAVHKSVVVPAQELKDVQQEISNLKTIQIEDLKVQRESRMNPDSTAGLAPSAEMRLQARRMEELKERDKEKAALRAVNMAAKKVFLTEENKSAFDRVVKTIKDTLPDVHKCLTLHSSAEDIKLAFRNAGGKVKEERNSKRS